MFALLYRWVTQVKYICGNNSQSEKDWQLKLFSVVKREAEVSLEPADLSCQNNPHAKVVHLGEARSAFPSHKTAPLVNCTVPFIFIFFIFEKALSPCNSLIQLSRQCLLTGSINNYGMWNEIFPAI